MLVLPQTGASLRRNPLPPPTSTVENKSCRQALARDCDHLAHRLIETSRTRSYRPSPCNPRLSHKVELWVDELPPRFLMPQYEVRQVLVVTFLIHVVRPWMKHQRYRALKMPFI